MKDLVIRVRNMSLGILNKLAFLPPLLARLVLGWVFFKSGWGKLHNLSQVTEYFQSLGIPAASIQAPFVAGLEFICGLMLVFGLLTRLAAVPMMGTMVVALLTAKLEAIQDVDDATGFSKLTAMMGNLFNQSEFLYILLLGWLVVAGAGAVSLDSRISRSLDKQA